MPPRPDAARWGVVRSFMDATGVRRRASRDTLDAILEALGSTSPGPPGAASVVLAPGEQRLLAAPATPVLEDGTVLASTDRVGPDLPLGVHRLEPLGDAGEPAVLIVAPARCPAPHGLRVGGLAVQVYAARSGASWGIGDLADLHAISEWARGRGARIILVSPLHDPGPTLPLEASPYSPSSRRFRTPLALRIEDIPGYAAAAAADPELSGLAERGRALNAERLIDRDAVHRLKMPALERLHALLPRDPGYGPYCLGQGDGLRLHAVHAALAEVNGACWRRWPEELRRPRTAAVEAFAAAHEGRVDLHRWIQWQLDEQVRRASAAIPVMHDLAIGASRDGADAWVDQDTLGMDASIGVPPDEFNTLGQDWGLPPVHPWRLRAAGYEPFRATLRAALRHAGALRFDHVMGLFRLWWIPPGRGPAEGAYVRQPADDLLAILALESSRAGALVVGEDLGTVAPGIRSALGRRAVLSYRLLWFEDLPPTAYPRRSMAAVTTHDLPTIAGLWTGSDLAAQERLGLAPHRDAMERVRQRVIALGVDRTAGVGAVVDHLHAALAAGRSSIVTASLDDLELVEERPNMPGTVDAWPNWRLALPRRLDEITADPTAGARLEAVTHRPARPVRRGGIPAPGTEGTSR